MDIQKKLEHLIHHWMEHNEGHAAEYKKWAAQAEEEGLNDVARAILKAGEVVNKSNNSLQEALNLLQNK